MFGGDAPSIGTLACDLPGALMPAAQVACGADVELQSHGGWPDSMEAAQRGTLARSQIGAPMKPGRRPVHKHARLRPVRQSACPAGKRAAWQASRRAGALGAGRQVRLGFLKIQ